MIPTMTRTYQVVLINYADNDDGLNVSQASCTQEAETIPAQTNCGAEALTISLAMVEVCTNHGKNQLQCWPTAQKLIQEPILWLTALSADGVLF